MTVQSIIQAFDAARAAVKDCDNREVACQARLDEAKRDRVALGKQLADIEAWNVARPENEKPKSTVNLKNQISDADAEVERQNRKLAAVRAEKLALDRALKKAAFDERWLVRGRDVFARRDAWLDQGVAINEEIAKLDAEEQGMRPNTLDWLRPEAVEQMKDFARQLTVIPAPKAPPKDSVPMQADVSWVGSPAHSVFGHTSAYAAGEIAWFDKRIAAQLEKTGKWHYQPQTKSKAA
jgi:hypothetical protein